MATFSWWVFSLDHISYVNLCKLQILICRLEIHLGKLVFCWNLFLFNCCSLHISICEDWGFLHWKKLFFKNIVIACNRLPSFCSILLVTQLMINSLLFLGLCLMVKFHKQFMEELTVDCHTKGCFQLFGNWLKTKYFHC